MNCKLNSAHGVGGGVDISGLNKAVGRYKARCKAVNDPNKCSNFCTYANPQTETL